MSEDTKIDPIVAIDEPEWKKDAACAGDTRFTYNKAWRSKEVKRELMDKCETCPVYDNCLSYVEKNKPEKGVWAGVSRSNKKDGQKVKGYHEDGTPVTIEEARELMEPDTKS